MRAVFGLAGILIVIGVIVWWMGAPGGELDQNRAAIKAGNQARETVSQVAGHDLATGGRAMDSATFELLTSNNKPASMNVVTIVPGGAYERYFGLKKDDIILAVHYQGFTRPIREMDNLEDGREQVAEAFQRQGSLTVKRNGKEITLPAVPGAPAAMPAAPAASSAPPPASPTAAPAAPAAQNTPAPAPAQPRQSPLERQLNQIQQGAARSQGQ
jgi:hypothetical protein